MTRLANPWESAAVAALAIAGVKLPACLGAAGALFALLEIRAGFLKRDGPRWLPAWWPRPDGSLTLLYDGTCVLCARSKAQLERWPTASSIRFLALQSPEARALLPDMDEKTYLGAMHVLEGGKVWSAHEAWYRIAKLGPLPLAALMALTPRAISRPLYACIARNRYRWFGKLCEGGSCRVHTP